MKTKAIWMLYVLIWSIHANVENDTQIQIRNFHVNAENYTQIQTIEQDAEDWNTGEGGVKWQFNCDFFGNDIRRLASTGEQCGGHCIANTRCSHFHYSDDGFCNLKNPSIGVSRTSHSGGVCGFLPWRSNVGNDWRIGGSDVKWQINCDFYGNDIDKIASSGEDCGNICIAMRPCTHFRYLDGFCYMKAAPITTVRTPTNGGVCGYIPWKFDPDRDHWNPGGDGVKWLLNCDFFGHDIGQIASTGELCGGLCVANPECNHFRLHEGFCYLKKAPLSTPRTPINSGMCGFVPYRNFDDSIATCPKIDDLPSECRPIKDCAVWYDQILTIPGTACKLSDGNPGACCPDLPTNSYGPPLRTKFGRIGKKYGFNYNINTPSMNQAAEASRLQMSSMGEIEKRLTQNNIIVLPGSSRAIHALVFATTAEAEKISREAIIGAYTASEIVKRFNIKPENVALALNQFNLKDTILSEMCPTDSVCNQTTIDSRYRTLDGSCNNIQHSSWGRSLTPFQRLAPSAYADGVRVPRRAKSGRELPSARLISTTVTRDVDAPSETDTTWVMQYGQFLDHDFTRTPEFRMANSSTIPCCMPNGGFIDKNLVHPECFPIEIPRGDTFFSRFGQRCMPLVRSAPGRRPDCSLGCAEQMNQFTHYLDQSNVYGSDDKLANELRTFQEGKLKVTRRSDLDLLPADDESKVSCALSKRVSGIDPPSDVKCFKAGDSPRVNEHPNLAVTHIVFLREHNRLAEELARLNSHWDDERLYQEAKRILTAQMQHITYNEWVPIIIGREKMQQLGLLPLQRGFSQDYDSNLNPTIFNEFAGAAFRFGHTLIQGRHHLTNARGTKERDILLRQHFFKTQEIYTPGNLDKFLIGLATQPGQKPEHYFSKELTNHLFEEEGKGFGLDLVSLNIQRGRDHGIPGYNAYRSICGLSTANNFNDLCDLIPSSIVDRFERLYESVDDIDLFIGSISERLAKGAVVGPTFQCLIGEQFLRLKRGDRYFYDLAGQSGSFTEEQLNEIRRTSFARLVCDNSNVRSIQPLIFKSKTAVNPIVDCESSSIPRVNLRPWQEV
ncbi:hypothetical protein OUZ56_030921 [Daphnia magna]|uniref:Apple domain-containing protein n=2 Tax=Daphnia magna TaxID=35525 RepID=A0ABQ9ZT87_9CRUS|nr:hypothetical protein OUZ56_030921 [Daphnia magna]